MSETIEGQSDLGYLTNRLARLLRGRLVHELEPLGLTGPQAAVLLALTAAAAPLTVSETAGRLGIDRPTMTGLVERLRRDGWIETTPNPGDGRSRLLVPTARAAAARRDLENASAAASGDALAGLRADERAQLLSLLARAASSLDAACRGAPAGADMRGPQHRSGAQP